MIHILFYSHWVKIPCHIGLLHGIFIMCFLVKGKKRETRPTWFVNLIWFSTRVVLIAHTIMYIHLLMVWFTYSFILIGLKFHVT
jgi:hypothetical protein